MNTKVLIITDDENLQNEIINTKAGFPNIIEFEFAVSEDEAKRLLGTSTFQIIGVEYSSKITNGIEFLGFVKEKYPKTFRILFTDSSERERAVYSTCDAHRFINKPLKNSEFDKSLTYFQNLVKYELDSKLVSAILGIGVIPTLPEVYVRLEREINRQEVSISRIADIISNDPLVVAKIMHIVYSSFYNISKSIVNLVHAINFLGLDIIKSLVLYIKVFIIKNQPLELQNYLKKVRDHSIDVAKVSKAIMNLESGNRELIDAAYIAGLLHDIGKIILVQCDDKVKRLAFVKEHINGEKQLENEFEKFGVSHVNAGAFLLSTWNFPENLIEAIALHHQPEIIKNGELGVSQVVYIANALINSSDTVIEQIKNVYGAEKVDSWFEFIPEQIEEQ
ncbi:MAG: metal-dependent hydrolase HDOD [Ignavibacteria bacterium]|nr:MAG: metal-dependent hydrolase HDOD [Ignavibacteria bacterium]KAF0161150.1 MAG: metal-dependent hydrolase HDOD [Ignavibacteria bacterium]